MEQCDGKLQRYNIFLKNYNKQTNNLEFASSDAILQVKHNRETR